MRILPVFLFSLIASSVSAQNTNAYQFIEPTISLTYDSTHLKFQDRYTNTVYGREQYGFLYTFPSRTKTYIQVGTDLPVRNADPKYQDSVSKALIKQMNRFAGD